MLGLTNNDVVFATLTSKASLVLRLKGNPSNTIHKTFYSVYKSGKTFRFNLKRRINDNIRLIVIDEVSMVNINMLNDILSFGVPVIALGDCGQLSPIFGGNIFDIRKPDVFLTMVMRQSDESGILEERLHGKASIPASETDFYLLMCDPNGKCIDGRKIGTAFQNGRIAREYSININGLHQHHYIIEYIGKYIDNAKISV